MTFKNNRNFVSFEGLDFSGKTTQIELLVEKLRQFQIEPLVVREPGGTEISEKIREILLDCSHHQMHPRSEILLYSAARAQLVHQIIIPALEQGKRVIADRFFDSTSAYQGAGRGVEADFVRRLNDFATSGLTPYRTFFIDISPEEAERRRRQNSLTADRMESGGPEFYRKIRKGFLRMAGDEPKRFITIDGQQSPPEIATEIWRHISAIWKLKG